MQSKLCFAFLAVAVPFAAGNPSPTAAGQERIPLCRESIEVTASRSVGIADLAHDLARVAVCCALRGFADGGGEAGAVCSTRRVPAARTEVIARSRPGSCAPALTEGKNGGTKAATVAN